MKLHDVYALVTIFFFILTGIAVSDELEDRAIDHDDWANTYHFNPYGGVGYVYFEAPESDVIHRYAFSDSTIWTGTYLAAEAFRYAVTKDAQAKQNALRTIYALDAHLQVTQVPGFIARCVAPDEPPYNTAYIGHSRYVEGTGDWEGSFWINNTSRDQYSGWFYGLSIAYDLIDDEQARQMIREDVSEVIYALRDNWWYILGENGMPTDAGPHVLPTFRLAWLAAAVHILDTPEIKQLYLEQYEQNKYTFKLSNISGMNKYYQYYGFNLSHLNFNTLLRNETDPERRAFYLDVYHQMIWRFVSHTHNVFFDAFYLANCERAGGCFDYDQTLADVQVQLFDFQDPPVREVPKAIPDWELDPFSVFMSDLIDLLGIRNLLDIEYQTLEPRPVQYRCPRSFMWQKTPYNLDCPGGDGTEVYPGIDYMLAYWMGRYYDLIDPGNPNGIYWPGDEDVDDDDDDDDDDDNDDNDDDNNDDSGDDPKQDKDDGDDTDEGNCCG